MTRFSMFPTKELDIMEEAFIKAGLKYFVFEIRREKTLRVWSEEKEETCN